MIQTQFQEHVISTTQGQDVQKWIQEGHLKETKKNLIYKMTTTCARKQ